MRIPFLPKWLRRPAQEPADQTEPEAISRRRRRKGVTSLEYVVMISFILMLAIMAIQQVGLVTAGLLQSAADATTDNSNPP
jgi:hypothetical protein